MSLNASTNMRLKDAVRLKNMVMADERTSRFVSQSRYRATVSPEGIRRSTS